MRTELDTTDVLKKFLPLTEKLEQRIGRLFCYLVIYMGLPYVTTKRSMPSLVQHLVFKVGPAPPDKKGYKAKLLPLCLDLSKVSGLQAAVRVLSVANGDWQRRDLVEHYLPAGQARAPAGLATTLADTLTQGLASRQPSLWRRDKWTGFREALGDLLVLQLVHGLLKPSYETFLELIQGQGRTSADALAPHLRRKGPRRP